MTYIKSKHTAELLFNTSVALFRDKGFEKTSLREIARQTDLNVAALYYYFPNGKASVAKKLRESHLKECIKVMRTYVKTDDYLLFYLVLLRFLLRELLQDEREMNFYIESWSDDYDLNRSFTIETYTASKDLSLNLGIKDINRATVIGDSTWSGLYKAKRSGKLEISHKEIRDTTDIVRWTYLGLPKEQILSRIKEAEKILEKIPVCHIHLLYF